MAKHEIFATDVNNCFTSLKKAVQELRKAGAHSESLEMALSSVKPDTITFREGDAGNMLDFEFELCNPVSQKILNSSITVLR